jgi:DNA-binding beta-propeller fold protein YncE
MRSDRWSLWGVLVSLLIADCSGSVATVPQPTFSSGPVVLGRGTVAVVDRQSSVTKVLIFPPNSDTFTGEISIHTSRQIANSAAFDRRGRLFVGLNDPSAGGKYEVLEFNVPTLKLVRDITNLPSWSRSSVATDDENVLYVNTKSLVGGDIKLYRPGETKPSIEIKDHHSPVAMTVASGSLWVGFEGAFADALARYRLRSANRTWFETIGNHLPLKLAVNPGGSLIAAKLYRNSKGSVDVADVSSGKRKRILDIGPEAMASDDSGHLYAAELRGKIHTCTFTGCSGSFDTGATNLALAVSPVGGLVYVACIGKTTLQVFDPRTRSVTYIPIQGGGILSAVAIEP